MAKQVTGQVKLQCPGGQATPAPPVGPALGQHGVNIGQFVSQFNDKTKDQRGMMIPVVITVFSDRTFTFEIKSPPAADSVEPSDDLREEGRIGHRAGFTPRWARRRRPGWPALPCGSD